MYPGYEPVKILDTFAKIHGQQVYHHKGRDEYSIEQRKRFTNDNYRYLVPLTEIEQEIWNELLAFEKCVYDAQDRQDDEGKEAGRDGKRMSEHYIDDALEVEWRNSKEAGREDPEDRATEPQRFHRDL